MSGIFGKLYSPEARAPPFVWGCPGPSATKPSPGQGTGTLQGTGAPGALPGNGLLVPGWHGGPARLGQASTLPHMTGVLREASPPRSPVVAGGGGV